ncbi:MAG: DUF4040 domain-containing protein [Defluviitaleaceae bacterium]|nr:DUF4040 domain-containing protein [Defluviitaleaceae bacterium]
MIEFMLAFWIIAALCIIRERRVIRIFVYFGIFSLVTSVIFMLLGSPDVAMAEAAIGAFTTVFFIVCFEKYYGLGASNETVPPRRNLKTKFRDSLANLPAAIFCTGLFALFVAFIPDIEPNTYLKDQYITYFMADIGGENAVGAIYLGYRVFDTVFEALVLVISVVAVIHMSEHTVTEVRHGRLSEIRASGMAVFTIRIICPLLVIFGFYLIANGHISPGGGFQGGLAIAAFFICRYMVYNIYDVPIIKVIKLEEIVFVVTVVMAMFVVFLGMMNQFPAGYMNVFQDGYLMIMNFLIGMKVTCGFIILFYRYIAIERMD